MPYRLALDLRSEPMTQSPTHRWQRCCISKCGTLSSCGEANEHLSRHLVIVYGLKCVVATVACMNQCLTIRTCRKVISFSATSTKEATFVISHTASCITSFGRVTCGISSGTLEVTATAIAESIPFASRLHRGCIEAASATTDRGCIEAASATTEAASTSGSMGKHWHGSWATAVDRAGSAQDPHHPGGRASLRGVPESRFR